MINLAKRLCRRFTKELPNMPYNVNQQLLRKRIVAIGQAQEQRDTMTTLVPRRKRRVYDRPRHDTNIQHYCTWRISKLRIPYEHDEHTLPVKFKLEVNPALFTKAFGIFNQPEFFAPCSTREYYFQDNELSQFIVYDFKATTRYHGDNLSDYDYDNQLHIQPRRRKEKHPTYDQFWNSEKVTLRVSCSRYGSYMKFKTWLLSTMEAYRLSDKSYDQILTQQEGDLNGYNSFDQKYELVAQPYCHHYVAKDFYTPEPVKKAEKIQVGQKKKSKKTLKNEQKLMKQEQQKQNQLKAQKEGSEKPKQKSKQKPKQKKKEASQKSQKKGALVQSLQEFDEQLLLSVQSCLEEGCRIPKKQ